MTYVAPLPSYLSEDKSVFTTMMSSISLVFEFDELLDAIHAVRQAVKSSVYFETSFKCLA